METKTIIRSMFPHDFIKYETWLQNMAKEGWILEKIESIYLSYYLSFNWLGRKHIFRRSTPKKIKYVFDHKIYTYSEKENYTRIYKDFGWNLIFTEGRYNVCSMEYEDKEPVAFNDIGELSSKNKSTILRMLGLIVFSHVLYMPDYIEDFTSHFAYSRILLYIPVLLLNIYLVVKIIQIYKFNK